jgi:hypothetical protein
MDFLKTLNFTDTCKYYYYYDNCIFCLEYRYNKWYLYNINKKKSDIIYNIEDFINTNKYKLERSNLMVENNDEFVKKLIKIIGEFTFCTKFILGWNICNSKIKLKITIDKFTNIDNKTIKIQHTCNNNIYDNIINISGEELLKLVNDNIDMILYKDPIKNDLEINDVNIKLNDLEINDDNIKLNDLEINDDNIKLSKTNIDEIKKTLFIKLSKARKIYYQSCLPYDDNKKKLEMLYGIKLDLN